MEYTAESKRALIASVLSGKAKSTLDLVRLGIWRESERSQLTADIIGTLKPSKPNTSKDGKLLIFLGGGPISGKSTVKHLLLDSTDLQENAAQISSEKLRAAIPEYAILRNLAEDKEIVERMHLSEDDLAKLKSICYDFVVPEMRHITQLAIEKFSADGVPIILESHMDEVHNVQAHLATAKSAGYESLLIAPDVDIPTFFARGKKRLEETGKRFPIKEGLLHHRKFEENWPQYIECFDVACRIDNNGRMPSLMALAIDGKLTVLDEVAYARAREKTGINIDGRTPEEALHYQTDSGRGIKPSTRAMGNGAEESESGSHDRKIEHHALNFLERALNKASIPLRK